MENVYITKEEWGKRLSDEEMREIMLRLRILKNSRRSSNPFKISNALEDLRLMF